MSAVFLIGLSLLSRGFVSGEGDTIVNLDDYQRAAKGILDLDIYDYAAGGGWYELTENRNRLALQSITLWPRYMRDVSQIDTNVTVLGKRISFPIGISPSAFHHMFTAEGEIATAKACEALGNIYAMSYYATETIEAVAAAAPEKYRKWMDIYLSKNRTAVEDVVRRAEKSGFEAVLVTIDGVNYGRRFRTIREAFNVTDRYPPANLPGEAGQTVAADPTATWDTIRWLTDFTKLPVIVKGVLHPLDAREAVRAGVSGVYVSNHGGRQLDGTSPTIEALPDVIKEVRRHKGRDVDVYTDGGYREGVDAVKPFSYGVNYLFLGRPTTFMLAVNGSDGVVDGFTMLYDELRDAMQLAGYPTLSKIGRSLTEKCTEMSSSSKWTSDEPLEGRRSVTSIASSLVSGATHVVSSFFGRPSPGQRGGASGGTDGGSSSIDGSCDD